MSRDLFFGLIVPLLIVLAVGFLMLKWHVERRSNRARIWADNDAAEAQLQREHAGEPAAKSGGV